MIITKAAIIKDILSGKEALSLSDRSSYYFYRLNSYFFVRRFSKMGSNSRILGKPRILSQGEINVGDDFLLTSNKETSEILAFKGATITIGNSVTVGYGVVINAKQRIDIGDFVLIGNRSVIIDTDYHGLDGNETKTAPIRIGNHVWIAWGVIILKGVTIGNNSIVAAGSIVTDDVPPNTIVGGNPAKVIRPTKGWTIVNKERM
jgi:acetyltransferase-like isoleucine patch superfamily enzyme